jgi:hypothetical protein
VVGNAFSFASSVTGDLFYIGNVGSPEGVIVSGTTVALNGYTIGGKYFDGITGGATFINNAHYNPIGTISNPFDNKAGLNINDTGGGSATPANKTALTVVGSPKLIVMTIGAAWTATHTLVIQIDGTQVVSLKAAISAGTVYSFSLAPGETYYVQYQSGQATWVVSGQ